MSSKSSSKSKISKVLLHARGRHRLGEHHSLSTRSAIWVMVGSSSTPPRGDWRPRLGGDPVLSVVEAYCLIGEVGVHVDLVYHRHHVGLCGQLLQVLDLEVRYANRASPTVALDFLESLVTGAGVSGSQLRSSALFFAYKSRKNRRALGTRIGAVAAVASPKTIPSTNHLANTLSLRQASP